MKTKINLCIAYFLVIGFFLQRANAQANRQLSNLISPTKVNQSVIPITTNSKDLGTMSISWRNTYLSGSIYIDGKRFLTNGNDSTNMFVGTDAGNKRSTSHTGRFNTATGYQALFSYTSGSTNTANGAYALYSSTSGFYNTAIGFQALYKNAKGSFNTGIGYYAGSDNDNNSSCTFVGYNAGQSVSTDFNNSTAVGSASRITASNQVRIGNINVTSIGGYEPWTNLSDGRFKKNVKENVPGLAFINQLHAITYTMDVTSLRLFLGEDRQNEAEGKTVRPEAEALIQKGIEEKEKIIRTGFVAQEVEEAAKKIGYDFSGVDKPKNEHTPYGLRYSEFVVPLVKAVQELSQENNDLKKENNDLKTRMEKLEVMMNALQSRFNVSPATLEQNVPNPFASSTTIHYTLPEKFTSARIIITDKSGKSLKEVNVSGAGKGSIYINTPTLSAGTYQYSLIVGGKSMDTKQMILAK